MNHSSILSQSDPDEVPHHCEFEENKLKHSGRKKHLISENQYCHFILVGILAATILKIVKHLAKTNTGQEWASALDSGYQSLVSSRIIWIVYYRYRFLGFIAELHQNL